MVFLYAISDAHQDFFYHAPDQGNEIGRLVSEHRSSRKNGFYDLRALRVDGNDAQRRGDDPVLYSQSLLCLCFLLASGLKENDERDNNEHAVSMRVKC
ncbi:MAG: hypothetical protein ACE1ZA_19990, partial [Pseudomonadales bacterium]